MVKVIKSKFEAWKTKDTVEMEHNEEEYVRIMDTKKKVISHLRNPRFSADTQDYWKDIYEGVVNTLDWHIYWGTQRDWIKNEHTRFMNELGSADILNFY